MTFGQALESAKRGHWIRRPCYSHDMAYSVRDGKMVCRWRGANAVPTRVDVFSLEQILADDWEVQE